MDEAQAVDGFNGENNFCNIESCNVLREDLVFDQHGHQVAAGQELHEHVEEGRILEGGEELDDPRAVGLGQDISLCSHVGQLVLFEHFGFDERLHGVHLAIASLLDKLDLAEGTLANDLDSVVVLRLVLRSQEAKVLTFLPAMGGPELLSSRWALVGFLELQLQLALSITGPS